MINRHFHSILITGGAGFIGSNFIRYLFAEDWFEGKIFNLDNLTYAGNAASLIDIEKKHQNRYAFVRGDICERTLVNNLLATHQIDCIVHFAAESHVDRSITGPDAFIRTNVLGTATLLEAARNHWGERDDVLFHHISTDEVFGSLGETGKFTETTPYDPRSPYSASKAGSDHLVRAWHHTYGLPVTLSNCSNNYGPFQFPEKLIPLMLLRALGEESLPVYGDGQNVRDWLHVEDHARAVLRIIRNGQPGGTWNIGGNNEIRNIDLVNLLCDTLASITKKEPEHYRKLITFVKDRPGHDQRYAIDSSFIKDDLGWEPAMSFSAGLEKTIRWYLENREWIQSIQSGDYLSWIQRQY